MTDRVRLMKIEKITRIEFRLLIAYTLFFCISIGKYYRP